MVARMLNRFCHVALVVLTLYLGWAAVGDRPFLVASTYVSHLLARSSVTRELSEVDALRDISRRSRRLAETIPSDSDRRRLTFYADELDDAARRMEREASSARAFRSAEARLGEQ